MAVACFCALWHQQALLGAFWGWLGATGSACFRVVSPEIWAGGCSGFIPQPERAQTQGKRDGVPQLRQHRRPAGSSLQGLSHLPAFSLASSSPRGPGREVFSPSLPQRLPSKPGCSWFCLGNPSESSRAPGAGGGRGKPSHRAGTLSGCSRWQEELVPGPRPQLSV